MRVFISIILLGMGAYVLFFWLSGSHGHIRFRAYALQDWILVGLLFFCFGIPIFLFIKWMVNKTRT